MSIRSTKAADTPARLRGLLRRRSAELDAIRSIFRAINATSDLRSILDTIVHTTAKAMAVDSASIYLLDSDTQNLILKATTGLYPQSVDHAALKMGQGLTGYATRYREIVAVRDAWDIFPGNDPCLSIGENHMDAVTLLFRILK